MKDRARRRRWLPAVALTAVVAVAAGVALRQPLETAAVLIDLADGPGGRGLHRGADPGRQPFAIGADAAPGDIYRPSDPSGRGLVLLPGLTPAGKDDPLLADFAMALARARFTVLVPELAGRRTLSAGTGDVAEIARAVDALAAETGQPVVLAAVSFAVGPALLAALDPKTGGQVHTVLALGGYRDMAHMVGWIVTGQRRDAPVSQWTGGWVAGEPPPLALWVFLRGNLHLLNDPNDRALLAELSRRRSADPVAPVNDLLARLGPEGRAVMELLLATDPARVPELIAVLPPRLASELAALDLSGRDLQQLEAGLILVHGQDDPVIPWTESVDLAAAADPDRTDLFLLARFGHTQMTDLAWTDIQAMWGATSALLATRTPSS